MARALPGSLLAGEVEVKVVVAAAGSQWCL